MELSEEEISEIIDEAVEAIYERAYNDAIDDVLAIYEKDPAGDFITHVRNLRKKCAYSLTKQ